MADSVSPTPVIPHIVQYDPYALSPQAIQAPPATLGRALRQIGPGLILAGSIVGTGELIATTHLGAKVGFALLWLVVVSCFIKVFVQAELGRHAISSGQTTLATFRRLPGPGLLVGWWWLIMMLFSQLQLAAMVGGVGQAFHMAVPGIAPALANGLTPSWPRLAGIMAAQPALPWAFLTAIGTSLLLAVGGYMLVEKGSTILVVIFTFVTVLCVALLPAAGHPIAMGSIADGLKFSLPKMQGALAAALAMFGITGVGATELVSYPYWCIEKGYALKTGPNDGSPEWLARASGWIRVMRLDAWLSMVVYTLATLAFYLLGAATLHGRSPDGLPGSVDAMLATLARMYAPVMGAGLATVFIVVGVFAVLYSTLYAATAANSRTLADFLKVNCGLRLPTPRSRQRWVRAFCILFPLLNLVLFIAIKDPVKMVLIGGFIQAMTLPILAGAAVFLRFRRTHTGLRPGMLWDVFLWLSLIGLSVAAGYGVYDGVMRWGAGATR